VPIPSSFIIVSRRSCSASSRLRPYCLPPGRIQVPYPVKRCTRVNPPFPISLKSRLAPGCTPSPRLCVGHQSPVRICFCLLAPAAYDLIIVLVDQSAPINPITLLKRHLRVNNMLDNSHLFSYTSDYGFSSLTKPQFLRRCNDIWHLLGYPRMTSHCFR
jgi:hypothetical protein